MSNVVVAAGNRGRFGNLVWFAAYLVTMAAVVGSLCYLRHRVLTDLTRPEALAQWQAWKAATERHDPGAPVQRRPVSSREPPALVLLRDYFAGILVTSLLVTSFLFLFLMLIARGVRNTRC